MIQRIPALRTLPRLSLPARTCPGLRPGLSLDEPLRKPTVAGGFSTIEAMAGALVILGEPEAARALDALHAAALERAWRLRRGPRPT
jgi:DTW domain-containing protein YfiP